MGNETEIADRILQYGHCAAIEVTNGLRKTGLDEKVQQANKGKTYLQELTNNQVPIAAGLIFYNAGRIQEVQGLDFALEVTQYNSTRAKQALNAVYDHPHLFQKDRDLITIILGLLEETDLKTLFHPTQEQWETFKLMYPELAGSDKRAYYDKIGAVKGKFLQEYTAQALRAQIPDSIIITEFRYSRHGDIDVVIIAQEPEITNALTKKSHFTPLLWTPQTPHSPQQTQRPYPQSHPINPEHP